MCGIAGIVNFDGRPPEWSVLEQMNAVLRHRGPDGEGIYIDGGVGFAHRRLAIIDLEGGAQPLVDRERTMALTYNGEVYNYREIRDELRGGVNFRTESDTEVVLRAYQRWGIQCLDRFRGMFAFALYDGEKGRIYLVRDRLGIKPIYYALDKRHLVFGSDMNAIMCDPDTGCTVDPDAVANYLLYQYVPTPSSIYKEVRKLKPGHVLEVDTATGQSRLNRYWLLDNTIHVGDSTQQLEEFTELMSDTIGIYVRSDVPFGAFLSGGVDSSIVTGLMGEVLSSPVQTFTIGYTEEPFSEAPFAAEASRILNTSHHEEFISGTLALEQLMQIPDQSGEPFGDSSAIPTFFVARSAAARVKMVLSGDGGDELFAGYDSYPAVLENMNFLAAAWGHLAGWQKQHDSSRLIYTPEQVDWMMKGSASARLRVPPGNIDFDDPILRFQYQDLTTYLLDDILTKVDRMSMASSLEVRVPLLDHKVVEFAFSLPRESRIRNDRKTGQVETKVLLKRLGRTWFSDAFLNRKKMGFGIPVDQWLRGYFREIILDVFANRDSEFFDFVDFDRMWSLVEDFYRFNGHVATGYRIYVLFMLKLWFDTVHRKNLTSKSHQGRRLGVMDVMEEPS